MTHTQRKDVIGKFLYNKLQGSKGRWGIEIRTLSLLERRGFSDYDFWMQLELDYDFNSFNHFFNDNCLALKFLYLKYLKNKQKEEIFEFALKYRL